MSTLEHEGAMTRAEQAGGTLTEIFAAARGDGLTPHEAALQLTRGRVAGAQARRS